ncbi:phenylalanine-specific permease [Salmonella enterica subsp. enterica serovar Typhi]|nr:phenylalanine-specific permease [Salmonella enterica subsp. enterica serovar Typhi]
MKNASTASGASVSDAASKNEPTLQRGLQNRHIQLIALGGAIGTGLFLGIGPAIQMAGPAVLLGYGVAGIIAFLIMRQLGEMVVEEPVSGSFAHFAWKYWGPFAGFLSGWNYWVMFVLVGMAELTAAGIYTWVEVKSNSSPFVMIFHNLDSNVVASALNFVILVASLSVYNSGVYSNSRMLFGLSVQGNAPKFLTRVSHRGVPVNSLMLSGAITSLVVLINYLLPQKAFSLLMALVVATLLLNWIMICLAHLRFRAAMRRKGRETQFKALFYPAGNYLCIAFLALILVLMCTMDDMRLSAILLPVWIVFLFIAFTVLRRKAH